MVCSLEGGKGRMAWVPRWNKPSCPVQFPRGQREGRSIERNSCQQQGPSAGLVLSLLCGCGPAVCQLCDGQAGSLHTPPEEWPSPLPYTARLSHELADLESMLPETLCCPTGCSPLGDGGVDSTCLASASVTRLRKPCLRFVTHSRRPLHFYF